MSHRRLSLALSAAAACSPVAQDAPDAPAADTTPPTVMQSNPADLARRFSVLQPITVVFDEPIDPTTVSGASVSLTYGRDEFIYYFSDQNMYRALGPGMAPRNVVAGTVSFDEVSSTLRFAPRAPLPYGRRFTLTLTGITDLAGNPLTTSISFMTFVNGARRDRPYSTQLQPQAYKDRRLDGNGFLVDDLRRSGPGTDTDWYTDDDPVSEAYRLTFLADGRLDREWSMMAGSDSRLGSPDDTISFGLTYRYDAMGRMDERVGHDIGDQGMDNQFGTPDDEISLISKYLYTGDRLTHWVHYDNAGANLTWRNTDDRCSIQAEYQYDAIGHRTKEILRSCGTDLLPMNTDDTMTQYFEYGYDANHALTLHAQRNPDESYVFREVYTNDANGLVTETLRYTTATGMGAPVVRTKTTYDANHQAIEVATYGAGMDTQLGTPDDVVTSYVVTSYDDLGNRVTSRSYDRGPDTIAFTGDDRPTSDVDYDTTH